MIRVHKFLLNVIQTDGFDARCEDLKLRLLPLSDSVAKAETIVIMAEIESTRTQFSGGMMAVTRILVGELEATVSLSCTL